MKAKFVCFLLGLSLTSCSKSDIRDYSYDEVSIYHIKWDDLLLIDETEYSVYVYSEYCRHCQQVKNEVIHKRLNSDCHLYFCVFNDDIPLLEDVQSTIGQNELKNIGILGTPSLISITNKHVSSNGGGEKYIREKLKDLNA